MKPTKQSEEEKDEFVFLFPCNRHYGKKNCEFIHKGELINAIESLKIVLWCDPLSLSDKKNKQLKIREEIAESIDAAFKRFY